MNKKQKLELTWIGKDKRPRLEPRILLEDKTLSYRTERTVTDNDMHDNLLIHGDNLSVPHGFIPLNYTLAFNLQDADYTILLLLTIKHNKKTKLIHYKLMTRPISLYQPCPKGIKPVAHNFHCLDIHHSIRRLPQDMVIFH